jgi:hypothetical protein
MFKRSNLFFLLTGVALFCASATSSAVDVDVVYTAAGCLLDNIGPGTNLSRTSLGVVENTGTSEANHLWIECPIVRVSNPVEDEPATVTIMVNDNNTSANDAVECRVECYDDDSSAYDATALETSSNGNYQSLVVDATGLTTYVSGRCVIGCTIPDSDGTLSGVVSYRVIHD